MAKTEAHKNLEEQIRLSADLSKELREINKQINEMTSAKYFGQNMKKGQKIASDMRKEFEQIYKKSDKITAPFKAFKKLTDTKLGTKIYDKSKMDAALKLLQTRTRGISAQRVRGEIGGVRSFAKFTGANLRAVGSSFGALRIVSVFKNVFKKLFNNIKKSISGFFKNIFGKLGFAGIIVGLFNKLKDAILAVDEAVASVVKTSGILDSSLNSVLIEATENAKLLGGNVKQAADFANALFKELSPAIPLTGKLLGNVAQIGERFGISVDDSAKFLRIVASSANIGLGEASEKLEGIITGLGKLGPAAVKNLVESYDEVTDSFALGLKALTDQALKATQLGITLSSAAKAARGLLIFQESVSDEFTASALVGKQLNLQKARQLAYEKDIVGATNEILNQVESIGQFQELAPFKQEAVAKAANLTVAELQKELRIRKEFGTLGRIDAASRESALTKIEGITRRINNAFFKVLASPTVQAAFNNLAEKIKSFLESGGLNKVVQTLSNAVDKFGEFLNTGLNFKIPLSLGGYETVLGIGGGAPSGGRLPVTSANDFILTPQGQVIKTNPRDYIMGTTNPQQMSGGVNNELVVEMMALLKDLRTNGVKATTYLDGRQVSRNLAMMNR